MDPLVPGLQRCGQPRAAVVVGRVVGGDDHQRHDRPVEEAVGSATTPMTRCACRCR
jgi:hypothetical protein